jgi:hypothetical protein
MGNGELGLGGVHVAAGGNGGPGARAGAAGVSAAAGGEAQEEEEVAAKGEELQKAVRLDVELDCPPENSTRHNEFSYLRLREETEGLAPVRLSS